MLTCNRYINLLVFYHIGQLWNSNTIDYTMSKYKLIFKNTPNKILIDDIKLDKKFIEVLDDYCFKWHCFPNNETIKVLYFCYLIGNRQLRTMNNSASVFKFKYYTDIYNKFFITYDSIVEENMLCVLHESLRINIKDFLNLWNEDFKYLWLSEKLTKLKNNV